MNKIIKIILATTLVVVNTLTLSSSNNENIGDAPTIKEIETIIGFREQILNSSKGIKITKRVPIEKPITDENKASKPKIFVEVTEDNKPVKEGIDTKQEIATKEEKNEYSKDNSKENTKKVNETINEKLDREEEATVVQSNEVAYSGVIGEVYACETEYEECKKVYSEEVEIKEDELEEVTLEDNAEGEPVAEEKVTEFEDEQIGEEDVVEADNEIDEPFEDVKDIIDEPVQPDYTGNFRDYVMTFYGGAYVWGGGNPNTGFDCSGLVQYTYQNFYGIWLPRTAAEQANTGYEVDKDNLAEGDLVIFQNSYSSYPDHIGMYIGQGEYIHASSPERGITTDSIYGSYFINNCISVRRHIGEPSTITEEPVIEEEEAISEEPNVEEDIVEEDNSYTLTMEATAYTHTGNPTATGVYPRAYHTVSVDPNVIPLGTRMYIEGYGYAVAEDTGGAIKGYILDLFFDTYEECVEWGYRTVNVTIID